MYKNIIKTICLLLLFLPLWTQGQNLAELYGTISDSLQHPVDGVHITLKGQSTGSISNPDGTYRLQIPAGKRIVVQFTHINYYPLEKEFLLQPGQHLSFNLILQGKMEKIQEVEIKGTQQSRKNIETVDVKLLNKIPVSSSGAVEQLVKTLPGVSSNNELSSQYSVRGGNFDENLVYVNDIEIYRPHLIRSGQQEGLSFVNPDLVSSIRFSSGGFDAQYGDKMSSVLDIRYKEPTSFEASGSISLLGATAHVENCSANSKLSYLAGIRYKTNRYLLNSLDTKGNYNPRYTDFQGMVNYKWNDALSLHLFGSISKNRYLFAPENRETSFGTISNAMQLRIFFDGQEKDEYTTDLEAITLKYHPNSDHLIKLIASRYHSREEENFDIQGQYYLNELFLSQGGDPSENLENLGIGTYLNHARNKLNMTVNTAVLRGSHNWDGWFVQWSAGGKHEEINDVINEWQYRDSAGYSIPYSDTEVLLASTRNARNRISSNHLTSFLQGTYSWIRNHGEIHFTGGLRFHYWDYTDQSILSPRFSVSYLPAWAPQFRFRFATGLYQQLPSYREMLTLEGEISPKLTNQKSIHYVLGQEYYFKAWDRPFKLSSEIYYKDLKSLIPYEIDNVRLRYYGDQRSKGYATGVDLRINGEFVPGTESWASLSMMKTEENIEGDGKGYLPRPTDQRINFSLFFQDYLPHNPSYKMQLSLFYGGRLPFWSPKTGKQGPVFKMPAYRRVDLGFSKILIDPNKNHYKGLFRHFKSMWLGLEIFNLLDINNTVSYLWINDIHNNQYAIPNYLTSRKINLKLSASF